MGHVTEALFILYQTQQLLISIYLKYEIIVIFRTTNHRPPVDQINFCNNNQISDTFHYYFLECNTLQYKKKLLIGLYLYIYIYIILPKS